MTLKQLSVARAEQDALEVYEGYKKDFHGFEVVGITVRRKGGGSGDNIVLQRGSSGTGTIASLGFGASLGEHMTKALKEWFELHINDAKAALKDLGVDTDA